MFVSLSKCMHVYMGMLHTHVFKCLFASTETYIIIILYYTHIYIYIRCILKEHWTALRTCLYSRLPTMVCSYATRSWWTYLWQQRDTTRPLEIFAAGFPALALHKFALTSELTRCSGTTLALKWGPFCESQLDCLQSLKISNIWASESQSFWDFLRYGKVITAEHVLQGWLLCTGRVMNTQLQAERERHDLPEVRRWMIQ